MNRFFRKLLRKGIRIQLEDRYCYPYEKDFVKPDAEVMKAAIEKYARDSEETVAFVQDAPGLVFVLNGRERYSATLKLGYGRFSHGYYIHCLEEID